MKKSLLLFFVFASYFSFATHPNLVDLTYQNVPGTNKYIFTVQVILIPGIPRPTDIIESNSPLGDISIPLRSQHTINPNCGTQSGVLYIFQSDTVDVGPLPASGYTFSHADAMRGPSLENIYNTASIPIYVETTMRPIPGQTFAGNSPRFIANAAGQVLSNANVSLKQTAMDVENDSLYYELVDIRTGTLNSNSALNYFPNSSGSSPFGNSIPVTIDQNTGEISATNVPQGKYALGIKVHAYTNGVLTSSINREIILYTSPTFPNAPAVSLANSTQPFIPKGNYYKTHFVVGQNISFNVNGNVAGNDSIWLGGMSTQFQNTNFTTGICTANCATFIPSPNMVGTSTVSGTVNFTPDSLDFVNKDTALYTFYFGVISQANCNMPLQNTAVAEILVYKSSFSISEEKAAAFQVYPNPTTGHFTVDFNAAQSETVDLISMTGQKMQTLILTPGKQQLSVQNLPNGLYFIQRQNGQAQKIIFQN